MKPRDKFDVDGQPVLIAGGSKGLGKELAFKLISRGANVTILARSMQPLQQACSEMKALIRQPGQRADFASVDLTNPDQVSVFVASLPEPPVALFCVAGGTSGEVGFLSDISADDLRRCYERNYLSAAFITQAILKRWLAEPTLMKTRHIIFTSSTAAFLGIPGYAAYTPTKSAIRALADTLRQEVLLYDKTQKIHIHCTFPGTIYTDEFFEEQKRKPGLTKELERTDREGTGISAEQAATQTLRGLQHGHFFITMDNATRMLLNNMRGPSPRDNLVLDRIFGMLGSSVWPGIQRFWDRKTKEYGAEQVQSHLQDNFTNVAGADLG